MYDIAIIGGGISGFSVAHRLQAKGNQTIILEKHGQPGGCAGFFSRRGFNFDVGATTLVDFVPEGVGGKYFEEVGMPLPEGEYLDYECWLPDRKVTLSHDQKSWKAEREVKFSDSPAHRRFWRLMDRTTQVFWKASRNGIRMPIRSFADVCKAVRLIGMRNLSLCKYLNLSMAEVLKKFGLEKDQALWGMLSMLVEDTVHSTLDRAPFINAALGSTIRGAGLMRAQGGMRGLWDHLLPDYLAKGGKFKRGTTVKKFYKEDNTWIIETNKGRFEAKKLISSLPIDMTAKVGPREVNHKLEKYLRRNEGMTGSAVVLFLGVPEAEVAGQKLTHHQLLQDYDAPLGNGNNMFISVSAPGDLKSAPAGYRAVMVSTHCTTEEWADLSAEAYATKKQAIGAHLLKLARRAYPELGKNPVVHQVGTPRSYHKFTGRTSGAVGGFRQEISNSNLRSVPHDIGIENLWICGDTTWPGLGTVAALMGSRIVANYAGA